MTTKLIPDELQQMFREQYNPDGSDLRNLQLRLLDMLVWFDSYCKSNGLRYWLSSGTCLGAVRHGGFIPWDDDIDVEMMQDDYDKLLSIFKSDGKYALQTPYNDLNVLYGFSKLRDLASCVHEWNGKDVNFLYKGCYIDIFPVGHNNFPRFVYQRFKQHSTWLHFFSKKEKIGPVGLAVFKALKSLHLRVMGFVWKRDYVDKNGTVRYSAGNIFYKDVYQWEDLRETVDMSFEGHLFPIPKGYDRYLRTLYNDYTALPDEKLRLKGHFTSFDLK